MSNTNDSNESEETPEKAEEKFSAFADFPKVQKLLELGEKRHEMSHFSDGSTSFSTTAIDAQYFAKKRYDQSYMVQQDDGIAPLHSLIPHLNWPFSMTR
jgi:hypothetical protein